jgi:lysophospholipase L1-like esterase
LRTRRKISSLTATAAPMKTNLKNRPMTRQASRTAIASGILILVSAALQATELRFDFGTGNPLPNFTRVTPQTLYQPSTGMGFLSTPSPGAPSAFAVDIEEGNYQVAIRFGHPHKATSTCVKAESRRLMLENVTTQAGKFETRTFTVNVRKPAIRGGGNTSLNTRETGPPCVHNWDERLSFEFNGAQPGVAFMEIKSAPATTTVFLAGDSTVTDQQHEPWAGWGQMLPRFFSQDVAISNHAESGLALHSFERQKRLDKILSMMKAGDYLFIQFGHNDQKDKSAGAGPFTSYKANLKRFILAARSKGGIPVLVTPMERRRWNGNTPLETLSDFALAVRQTADEQQVPLIDLHAMSLKLYTALGPEDSKKAFVHYPANSFPGQDVALKDDTHHGSYGGYQLARCMVEGIRAEVPELASQLAKDATAFNPAQPDSPEEFKVPASPIQHPAEKPAGN